MLVSNPKEFFLRFHAKVRSLFIFRKTSFNKALKSGSVFRFDFNYDSAVKNMYLGIYEIEIVEAMNKILKKGDTFIDVGANIGYLSTVALGLVGKSGHVHSFEPVQEYFSKLRDVTFLNPGYNFIVNQCALGEREGIEKIAVTNLQNIGWNTIVPGFMSNDTIREIKEVPIHRLDSYIKEKALDNITLIKIDTEGFEFPVLKGLSNYFECCDNLPAIICEIAPTAYPLLGYQLSQLSEYMKKFNYAAFELDNSNKRIDITKLEKTTNVLFSLNN
ncbi:MAG: FkbM family methyltransferase [Candidatus Omnitrophota bacterium]